MEVIPEFKDNTNEDEIGKKLPTLKRTWTK